GLERHLRHLSAATPEQFLGFARRYLLDTNRVTVGVWAAVPTRSAPPPKAEGGEGGSPPSPAPHEASPAPKAEPNADAGPPPSAGRDARAVSAARAATPATSQAGSSAGPPAPVAVRDAGAATSAPPEPHPLLRPKPLASVILPNKTNPLVAFRLVFRAGSVDD